MRTSEEIYHRVRWDPRFDPARFVLGIYAATHLTSDHTDNGAARRDAELALLTDAFAGIDGTVVLMGDINDGTDRPARMLGLRDAWTEVHGARDATPTFDPGRNPLAAVSSLSGRAERFDRVLLRGSRAGSAPRVVSAALLGEVEFVSDHYGVSVEIALPPGR
jgi:poly(A) polymerase